MKCQARLLESFLTFCTFSPSLCWTDMLHHRKRWRQPSASRYTYRSPSYITPLPDAMSYYMWSFKREKKKWIRSKSVSETSALAFPIIFSMHRSWWECLNCALSLVHIHLVTRSYVVPRLTTTCCDTWDSCVPDRRTIAAMRSTILRTLLWTVFPRVRKTLYVHRIYVNH